MHESSTDSETITVISEQRKTATVARTWKRRLSYQEKRHISIEKLKTSFADLEFSVGRRKSRTRDVVLTFSGSKLDYHAFLIWVMFSEGELNNVKQISATYSVLQEQKFYLEVSL